MHACACTTIFPTSMQYFQSALALQMMMKSMLVSGNIVVAVVVLHKWLNIDAGYGDSDFSTANDCQLQGPWKRKCTIQFMIVTQFVAPSRVNDQYLTNVVLKINVKFRWDELLDVN
ncbi:hypothetical protein QYE76_058269 [Lolium multiflorum]|uniref:Uncharacterized protein n=1 Tax=Lolium multiflorum TaxID=4521 RepID=A0AAD8T6A1_LOLMU|nr:hypothetical protein QYE76_058268 [Lolium multiflorum]KAK1670110.1 hypothetical protein QYE76_058269 [Lolium multiflorum]